MRPWSSCRRTCGSTRPASRSCSKRWRWARRASSPTRPRCAGTSSTARRRSSSRHTITVRCDEPWTQLLADDGLRARIGGQAAARERALGGARHDVGRRRHRDRRRGAMIDSRHDAPVEVSVIVPLFNGERFVGDLLESLVRQDQPPPFEVLVCDNGSTDRSREVVGAYADRLRLTVIDAAERRGQAFARNRGARTSARPAPVVPRPGRRRRRGLSWHRCRELSASTGCAAARIDTVRLNGAWHGTPRHLAQEDALGRGRHGTVGVRRHPGSRAVPVQRPRWLRRVAPLRR